VFPKHVPPRATAEFNVIAQVSLADGSWSDQRVVRFVEVTLYQEADGQWRVAAYNHYEPLRGLRDDYSPARER
jgi:hypothetical protein